MAVRTKKARHPTQEEKKRGGGGEGGSVFPTEGVNTSTRIRFGDLASHAQTHAAPPKHMLEAWSVEPVLCMPITQHDYDDQVTEQYIKLWPAVEQCMATEWQRTVYETAVAQGCSRDASTARGKYLCLWASLPRNIHGMDIPMPGDDVDLCLMRNPKNGDLVRARVMFSSFTGTDNEPKTGLIALRVYR